MEDVLRGSSPQDVKAIRPSRLQTSCPHISCDEGPGETGLGPAEATGEDVSGLLAICLPAPLRSWWCCHLPAAASPHALGWWRRHCGNLIFFISPGSLTPFNLCYWVRSCRGWVSTTQWSPGLLTTWQAVHSLSIWVVSVLSPFLFTLYTTDLQFNSESCHLQKFSDDSVYKGGRGGGAQDTGGQLCGVVALVS